MNYEFSLILGVDELRIEGSDHGKAKTKQKAKRVANNILWRSNDCVLVHNRDFGIEL